MTDSIKYNHNVSKILYKYDNDFHTFDIFFMCCKSYGLTLIDLTQHLELMLLLYFMVNIQIKEHYFKNLNYILLLFIELIVYLKILMLTRT